MSTPGPLKIVYISNDGQLKIDIDAVITVFDKVGDFNFILYSINGRTRGGKSYVLNHFIRHLNNKINGTNENDWFNSSLPDGFPVDNGMERVTTGINIWSESFFDTRNGKKVAILLMDCQGLFDNQTTAQQNAVLFSLSNLFSSVMIYNLSGQIDELSLQQLDLYSEYSKTVCADTNDDNELAGESFNQNLVLLIRDFDSFDEYQLGFHDKLEFPEGAGNYYEDFTSNPKLHPDNHKVRQSILKSFSKIGIHLLPHPGSTFVRKSSSSSDSIPNPDFILHLKNFVTIMNSEKQSLTKTIAGAEVSGREFKVYINAWAKKYENFSTDFPDVKDMREATISVHFGIAISKAISYMETQFSILMNSIQFKEIGVPDKTLEEILNKSQDLFKNCKKIGSKTDHVKYNEEFESKCKKIYDENLTINKQIRARKEEADAQQRELKRLERERLDRLAKVEQEKAELSKRLARQEEETRNRLAALQLAKEQAERTRMQQEAERCRMKQEAERRRMQHEAEMRRIQQGGGTESKRQILAQYGFHMHGEFQWNGEVKIEGNTMRVTDSSTLMSSAKGGYTMNIGSYPGITNVILE